MDTCGYETQRCPDDLISGHIEYETVTLCGEDIYCGDECHLMWTYCPFCGKQFVQHKK